MWRCVAITAASGLALAACGPSADSDANAQGPVATKVADIQSPLDATPAGPDRPPPGSAREFAERLAASEGVSANLGFVQVGQMTCRAARVEDPYDHLCHADLVDVERGGRLATLDIELFDEPGFFEPANDRLREAVRRMPGQWNMATEPNITMERTGGEGKTKLNAACHQSLGQSNSHAYCLVQFGAMTLISTSVAPLNASTQDLTMGGENDNSDQDTKRAGDLALLGLALVSDVD